MTPRPHRWSRRVVRLASRLVPREERADWVEEWTAELAALESVDEAVRRAAPRALWFALGSIPHALWLLGQDWNGREALTMSGVAQDIRWALRTLARSPGFAVVAVLTLALGIGASSSIFAFVNGLLFRAPSGIAEPDRLVQVARSYETDPRWDNFSWPALRLIGAEARALSGVAGYSGRAVVIGEGTTAEEVTGQLVTGEFFGLLGVRPQRGRLLDGSDDVEPGAHRVVVLSDALWRRRFGADPGVVGRTVAIGAEPYTVVGVAPRGFVGPSSLGTPPALWLPAMQRSGAASLYDEWGSSWLFAVGRLRDGVSVEAARASMGVVATRLREADPVNEGMLVPIEAGVGLDPQERANAKRVSTILFFIVGVLLLLTCTNVANLFLARATGRTTEMGVRIALGAGRARLARQVLTESVVLALIAAACSVPIVLLAGRFLPWLFPFAVAVPLSPDARVFVFLALLGIGAGLFFGVVPALVASRRGVARSLREGATGDRWGGGLRALFVAAQLAISLGLVAGAALLGRSVVNARTAEPGFEPASLTAIFIDLAATGRYDEAAGLAVYERLADAVSRVPGVARVALGSQAPLAGGHSRSTVAPDGAANTEIEFEAEYTAVGPGYFETLGVPIVSGRALGGLRDEPEPVVVINEALAHRFWPGESALGKRIVGGGGVWRVVGVAGDVQMRSLRESANPGVYYPIAHAYRPRMVLHVRANDARSPDARAIRAAIASVDPALPVPSVVPLSDALTDSMGETTTIGYLIATFAGLALVLASIGLYGVVSFGVSQRTRELAIRTALGAEPRALVRLILSGGLWVVALGVAAGIGFAYAIGRGLESLLFGVASTDAIALLAASTLLVLTAIAAAWLPARRASRLDAATSLRR